MKPLAGYAKWSQGTPCGALKNEERLPGRSFGRSGRAGGRTNERKKDVGVTKSRMDGFELVYPGALLAPHELYLK